MTSDVTSEVNSDTLDDSATQGVASAASCFILDILGALKNGYHLHWNTVRYHLYWNTVRYHLQWNITCVCVCVHACVRACVRACGRAGVRACLHVLERVLIHVFTCRRIISTYGEPTERVHSTYLFCFVVPAFRWGIRSTRVLHLREPIWTRAWHLSKRTRKYVLHKWKRTPNWVSAVHCVQVWWDTGLTV